jgi:hypothetical protein
MDTALKHVPDRPPGQQRPPLSPIVFSRIRRISWAAAMRASIGSPRRRHRIRYSITVRQTKPIRAAIATIDEAAWTLIVYPDGGVAEVAETRSRGDRLIVRRTRLVGAAASPVQRGPSPVRRYILLI